MTDLQGLRDRIADKSARLAVVGLGYVGVPVAASFAAAGFDVVGVDPNVARVDALNAGRLPLATSEPGLEPLLQAALAAGRFRATKDESAVSAREVAIVAVDTPIDDRHRPDARQLERACRGLAERATRPCVVVIESTVAPRTLRDLIAPIFGEGVFLIHCPERVRPGRLLRNLRGMARLVGVADAEVGVLGTELYRNIVQADLVVTDWETAEVIKTAENATRDVQIALANQLALICDHVGVDFRKVREQINRLWSDQPLILDAGPGVGGHCLPKDPWLLVSAIPEGAASALIEGSRTLNDAMPAHVADIARHACERAGVALPDATIAVLGLTYEANSDDERNAPGPRVAAELERRGARVARHDPFVTKERSLDDLLRGSDVAVVVVPHSTYREADWSALGSLMRRRVVVDCRRALEADALRSLGFSYHALGVAALR
ncbi:MAG TPA: nucleotide sugar dehydrogenase [Candidatus Limnocylindria bacterium]|nr:nucleotide sugar dehydrogenase [Candidatus Limnocylindria bacterium]